MSEAWNEALKVSAIDRSLTRNDVARLPFVHSIRFLACILVCSAISPSLMSVRAADEINWVVSRLDERMGFMHSCSLAASSTGALFVSYAVADAPPAPHGAVYVATRFEGMWTREIVSTTLEGFGTSVAFNPVSQQPGVVFLNALGEIELWERAGGTWELQPVQQIQNQTWLTLTYDENGHAVLGRSIRTELDGNPYFFGHLEMRIDGAWHTIPLPVQGDYVNPIPHGKNIIVSSLAAERGSPDLHFVDLMRGLPNDLTVEVVDMLPSESISGDIQLRQVPLAVDESGNVFLAHMRHFDTQVDSFSELRFARVPPINPVQAVTIAGGGATQQPSTFLIAEGFASQMSIAATSQGKPYVFGISRGFDQLNYAIEHDGVWFLGEVDSAPSIGGPWRTTSSTIDPSNGAPIVAYSKGPAWRSDTAVYLATPQFILGDLNENNLIDTGDIEPFVSVLLELEASLAQRLSADMNGDGFTNGKDLAPFVQALFPT